MKMNIFLEKKEKRSNSYEYKNKKKIKKQIKN